MTPQRGPIVGIDLGTTNSLVAVCDERGPRVLGEIVPSVVRIEADPGSARGWRGVVGDAARDGAVEHPRTTITSVKRLMGRSLGDARGELGYLGYEVVEGAHGQARARVPVGEGWAEVSPQEVSAEILRALKGQAERELGVAVERAVVTVPAYFDDAQRQATRDAGRLAGLDVVRIVNEPTAAALAYGIGLGASKRAETIAVYDLGGGTFDVSVLRLTPAEGDGSAGEGGGGTDFFQVLSTAGDTRLGGDDADHMLVRLFAGEIRARLGMGETDDALDGFDVATRRALVGFARGVKERLSEEEAAQIRIEMGEKGVYEREITREQFEGMIGAKGGWIDRTMAACDRAMRLAERHLHGEGVDRVILVGGSTRVPMVRRRVGERFGVEAYTALDPDRVVALGAAAQGATLSGSGAGTGRLLLDVVPLSLGIETAGGGFSKMVVAGSMAPARATEMFSTQVDGQANIRVHVAQGEREMVADCRSLGVFELRGIPPMPAGIPQVEVEFLVDANGVLRVGAQERRSGKRATLQIVPNHGLSREEVERMEADSLEHAREDMTRRRVADLVANSRLDLKWIGDRMEKYGDRLEPDEREGLEGRLASLRGLVEAASSDWASVDADEFHAAKEALDRASVRLQEIGIAASLREE